LYALVAKPYPLESDPGPETKHLPKDYEDIVEELRNQGEALNDFAETAASEKEKEGDWIYRLSPWASRYFAMAQRFADDGRQIVEEDGLEQARFRQLVATLDRRGLINIAGKKLSGDPAWGYQQKRSATSTTPVPSFVLPFTVPMYGTGSLSVPKPDDQDYVSIQEQCELEVVFLVVSRLSNQRWKDLSESESGVTEDVVIKLLTDSEVEKVVNQLRSRFVNSRHEHEHEYARLVDRPIEESDIALTQRRTTSSSGTSPILRPGILSRQFDSRLRSGIRSSQLASLFAIIPKSALSSLTDNSSVFGKYQTLVERELLLERIRRDLRSETDDELLSKGKDIGLSKDIEIQALCARELLVERALTLGDIEQRRSALSKLAELSIPRVESDLPLEDRLRAYRHRTASIFTSRELIRIAMTKFATPTGSFEEFLPADQIVVMVGTGRYGDLDQIANIRRELSAQAFSVKHRLFLILASLIAFFCFWKVDINATSIHGFYRDRLSQAFLLRREGNVVGVEDDVRLSMLSLPESTGPYLLVNTAINLQGSSDLSLRDQRSDCFVLSKLYCGGNRTSYVKTTVLESAFPDIYLNTAMAISAAAASPNMGRMTSGFTVLIMTLLNVRLGYWIPNPSHLGKSQHTFGDVFRNEIVRQVIPRRKEVFTESEIPESELRDDATPELLNLFGLAFSGGGIRSAAFSLGVSQSLHSHGLFRHFDYLSTVSGGGYTGASIATLMRNRTTVEDEISEPLPGTPLRRNRKRDADPDLTKSPDEESVQEWTLPPTKLFAEMFSRLDGQSPWINLSDGGHIENLAAIELLRRECRIVVISDAEADPNHSYNGVANLIRLAKLELEVEIDIQLRALDFDEQTWFSESHWAVGEITYPGGSKGYLLYLKASLTGDEDESVREYYTANPEFPHEPTMDQFFGIGQFETYRSLGEHVGAIAMQQAFALQRGIAGQRPSQLIDEIKKRWGETLASRNQETSNDR
jgi:hypothetical protein